MTQIVAATCRREPRVNHFIFAGAVLIALVFSAKAHAQSLGYAPSAPGAGLCNACTCA
jgi:hypothetical protein